jgi:DNA-binding LacI/PurR family transcriptional regulator
MAIAEDEVARTLQGALLAREYLMTAYLQGQAHWNPTEELAFLEQLKAHRPAALLAFCSPIAPTHNAALRELAEAGVRVIHYGHYRVEPPDQEYLLPDYRRAAHMAAVRLLMAGCRELFLLGRWQAAPAGLLMEEGFRNAQEEHAGPYDPGRQRVEMLTASETYEQDMQALLDSFPDGSGVVCGSIDIAQRIQQTLGAQKWEGRGIRVIAIEHGCESGTEGVDALRFGRRRIMERLVAAATGEETQELREFVAPQWCGGGGARKKESTSHAVNTES